MRTLVLVCHPEIEDSFSNQFLIQSGQYFTDHVDYYDLSKAWNQNQTFNSQNELEKMATYDRLIIQSHLFWYQPPAILKIWIDQVFHGRIDQKDTRRLLSGKELGMVIITGAKATSYQSSISHGATMDDLLSPYRAMAHYWDMKWLPYFIVDQLGLKSQEDQWELMVTYSAYLESGQVDSFRNLQDFVIKKLDDLLSQSSLINETLLLKKQVVLQELIKGQEELKILFDLNQGEIY